MLRALLLASLLILISHGAQAATCTVDISDLNFGPVDTLSISTTESTAEVAIVCDQVSTEATVVTICANLGAGSGGAQSGLRQIGSGSSTLSYQIFTDTARSIPWGSSDNPSLGSPRAIEIPVSGTGASATIYLYGAVPSGQADAAAGSYTSLFAPSDATFSYAEGGALDCGAPAGGSEAYASFSVQGAVTANCLLDTEDIDFGSVGVIDSDIDASGDLSITCTPGTPYSVSLDGGLSGATNPEQRLMQSADSSVIYGLYTNPGRTSPWGEAAGTLVAGAGNGARQALPIYGRVPAQPVRPGNYSDIVVVVIAY